MKYPKVSVIIPLYNYKEYILDSVYSVMEQKYRGKIEIIVVDDASTDKGADRLEFFFKNKCPKIIRHKKNKGYSFAKNTGIRASTGEFIVLLDADDMLTPDSIRVRAQYLLDNPDVGMVHGIAYLVKSGGGFEYYCNRTYKLKTYGSRKIHAQTTMIRKQVHKKFGLYDITLRSRSDNEMWNRLDLYGYRGEPLIKRKFIKKPPLVFYRKHSRSMILYRKKHPLYNHKITELLRNAIHMRATQGISRENTPWWD